VILTQQIEGQREFRIFRRFVGDRSTEPATQRNQCLDVFAGQIDTKCTYDVAGLDVVPCTSGVPGTECLQLAVLMPLAYTADGGQRLVLVQEARTCYEVG